MKIAVFIPVRLDSTRLPRKALREISGKPVIVHLIERLKLAKVPDFIVLCTTADAIDDPLVEIARHCDIKLCRGSKEDLLARYRQAALENDVDFIINVDGDDILIDPEQVDELARKLLETDVDIVQYDGLPFGGAPLGVTAKALLKVCESKNDNETATGWSRFFKSGEFKVETICVEDEQLRHPEIRMTLDYPEDLEFFQAVFSELYVNDQPVRLRNAIRLILQRRDIRELNSGLEERYWAHFNSNLPAGLR